MFPVVGSRRSRDLPGNTKRPSTGNTKKSSTWGTQTKKLRYVVRQGYEAVGGYGFECPGEPCEGCGGAFHRDADSSWGRVDLTEHWNCTPAKSSRELWPDIFEDDQT